MSTSSESKGKQRKKGNSIPIENGSDELKEPEPTTEQKLAIVRDREMRVNASERVALAKVFFTVTDLEGNGQIEFFARNISPELGFIVAEYLITGATKAFPKIMTPKQMAIKEQCDIAARALTKLRGMTITVSKTEGLPN